MLAIGTMLCSTLLCGACTWCGALRTIGRNHTINCCKLLCCVSKMAQLSERASGQVQTVEEANTISTPSCQTESW